MAIRRADDSVRAWASRIVGIERSDATADAGRDHRHATEIRLLGQVRVSAGLAAMILRIEARGNIIHVTIEPSPAWLWKLALVPVLAVAIAVALAALMMQ